MEARKNPKKPDDPAEALRLAEERFESLIGLSSDWYWEQDDSYRFTVVTGSHLEASGVDAKRVLGTTRWDNDAVPVGDGGSWEKHKAVLKARRPFSDFVYKRLAANGEVHYFSVSGLPIFDGEGRFCGYRGVGKDITAARRADELLGLEHSITRRLAAGEGLPETMKGVIREICESQNWEVGRYFQLDEKTGGLRFVEAWSEPDPVLEEFLAASRKATFGPGVGLVGTAWQTGQPLWVPDLSKDSRAFLVKSTVRTGIRAAFLFPATSEGGTIGVMSFSSRAVREPEERLLQAVRVIGSQIGQFAQRKQAEGVLQ
ncbi:MAG TPA: GAF domain-containing protein, partial [Burkholderiales bacterium]|nr:GAF domain-containing protein [Burkholderiales bacterium]